MPKTAKIAWKWIGHSYQTDRSPSNVQTECHTFRNRGMATIQRNRLIAAGVECSPLAATNPGWRTATDWTFTAAYRRD